MKPGEGGSVTGQGEKVFLVGHSMGGAIVQTLALIHPEVIKGIVLVATGVRLKVFPMILNGIMNNFEETVRTITRFAYSQRTSSDLVERGISDLMRCRPEVLYGDFLACDRFDIMNEVEKIDLPTLVLCGDEDGLTPVKYSQFIHGRIKGSTTSKKSGVSNKFPNLLIESLRRFHHHHVAGMGEDL